MNILKGPITENISVIEEKYTFPLDEFQKHAIVSINKNHNVLVTAATGSGKSLVAEYAIERGIERGKKVIYTSPIKSLSNQKFYEFKQKFPHISVGILTGDIKFNPTADCIIMTTEILRNLLYNKNIKIDGQSLEIEIDVYNEVETVIFDEVHYINDRDRGTVWEECIMLLPREINLVMLSATIDRADKFAMWIHQIKDKEIDLIPNDKRVIPLSHYYYLDTKLENTDNDNEKYCGKFIEILSANGNFNCENYDVMMKIYKQYKVFNQKHDKKIVNDVIEKMEKKGLLPAIFFVFSRKKCESYAKNVIKNLNNHEEYGAIKRIVNHYIHQLDNPNTYIEMIQYQDIMKMLEKGICVHHSGLVPVFKEIIEILFSKNLIKVLFATETFAVGVNMPTKTVLFTGLTKYDGYSENFRNIMTHEYLQMAGRAGRRGLDTKGVVIHLPNLYEPLSRIEMQTMMTGKTQQIVSKFGLNYQFILKIILTNHSNLTNFIETSLMSKDISDKRQYVQSELDKLVLDKIDNCEIYMEYYRIMNPDPYIKITNRDIKNNRKRLAEIKKIVGFENGYQKYLDYLKQIKYREQLTDELTYFQTIIDEDIMKILKYLEQSDYIKHIDCLSDLSPDKVSIKGLIASQINECNPILFTEILVQNVLDDLELAEIAAILSIFTEISEESDHSGTTINKYGYRLNEKLSIIKAIADRLDKEEFEMGIELGSIWQLNFNMINITYEWASGTKMIDLGLTMYEGNFIKEMIKIGNIATNVQKMATILGKNDLAGRVAELQQIMMRDIVNVESLYIKI
jgi:superfamily II RNA helicase